MQIQTKIASLKLLLLRLNNFNSFDVGNFQYHVATDVEVEKAEARV